MNVKQIITTLVCMWGATITQTHAGTVTVTPSGTSTDMPITMEFHMEVVPQKLYPGAPTAQFYYIIGDGNYLPIKTAIPMLHCSANGGDYDVKTRITNYNNAQNTRVYVDLYPRAGAENLGKHAVNVICNGRILIESPYQKSLVRGAFYHKGDYRDWYIVNNTITSTISINGITQTKSGSFSELYSGWFWEDRLALGTTVGKPVTISYAENVKLKKGSQKTIEMLRIEGGRIILTMSGSGAGGDLVFTTNNGTQIVPGEKTVLEGGTSVSAQIRDPIAVGQSTGTVIVEVATI